MNNSDNGKKKIGAPTKATREKRKSIEAIMKRDNMVYLEFEQKCTNIANEFKHDSFMAYEMAYACMGRKHIFDIEIVPDYREKKGYIVYEDKCHSLETILQEDRTNHLNNIKYTFPKSFSPLNYFIFSKLENIECEDKIVNQKDDYYGFHQDQKDKLKEFIPVDIRQQMHRIEEIPIFLTSSNQAKKSALVEIDFTKPLEEIIAIVSTLKRRFDEDNSMVQNIYEYLGIEPKSDVYTCNFTNCDIYTHKNPKPLSGRLADVLFIYDCTKLGLTQKYTLEEINRYWNDVQNLFTEKMQNKTLKEYLEFAVKQIDEQGYKNFLKGIKNI
ncbi:MAG: hypothetical protein NTY39_11330 [Campylobacterales bacterium]|nr:hypothetical protein [Campylobacterales bacterium]